MYFSSNTEFIKEARIESRNKTVRTWIQSIENSTLSRALVMDSTPDWLVTLADDELQRRMDAKKTPAAPAAEPTPGATTDGRRCIGFFALESARAIEKYLEARGNFTSVLPTPNAEGLHPVMSDPGTETQYQLMCKAADAIDFTVNPAGR